MNEENQNQGEVVELEEEIKTENEGIQISNDVVAVIAGVAVSEVPGVAGMAGGFAGGITEVLSGKKNLAKGIKVEATTTEAKIDVNIIVEYGSRIPDVAFEIQSRIKKSVKEMTGLDVVAVNVHVQGVRTSLDQENKEVKEYVNKLLDNNSEHDKRFAYNLLGATGICVVPLTSFFTNLLGFRMTLLEKDVERFERNVKTIALKIVEYVASTK